MLLLHTATIHPHNFILKLESISKPTHFPTGGGGGEKGGGVSGCREENGRRVSY
jgi:hypothetical protein